MFSKVGPILSSSLSLTADDQMQLFSALGALLMFDKVAAHGHVKSWVIDGQAHAGFNPSNAAEYGATAERPTDNSDQGMSFSSMSKRISDGQVSPITLPPWSPVVVPHLEMVFRPWTSKVDRALLPNGTPGLNPTRVSQPLTPVAGR